MRTLRVALAQINTTVGDLDGNAAKIIECDRPRPRRSAPTSSPSRSWRLPATRPRTSCCAARSSPTTCARSMRSSRRRRGIAAVVGFVDYGRRHLQRRRRASRRPARRRRLPQAVPAELRRLRRGPLLPAPASARRCSRSPASMSASTSARTSGIPDGPTQRPGARRRRSHHQHQRARPTTRRSGSFRETHDLRRARPTTPSSSATSTWSAARTSWSSTATAWSSTSAASSSPAAPQFREDLLVCRPRPRSACCRARLHDPRRRKERLEHRRAPLPKHRRHAERR